MAVDLARVKHILEVELSSFKFISERAALNDFGRGYLEALNRAIKVASGENCGVVQSVERGTVNAEVGGSRPSAAAIPAPVGKTIAALVHRIKECRALDDDSPGLGVDWRALAESIERDLSSALRVPGDSA